jgi:hypothetical protein
LLNLSVLAGGFHPIKNDTTKSKIVIADTTLVVNQEIIILWTKKNATGVTFNEVAFVNWNAGGNNSISALFFVNFQRKYQKKIIILENQCFFTIWSECPKRQKYKKN